MEVKKDDKGIQIQLGSEEAIEIKDGVAFAEIEIFESDKWCSEHIQNIGQRLTELLRSMPGVVEVQVRSGQNWIVKKLVTARDFIGE